jgi:hypothetical protein
MYFKIFIAVSTTQNELLLRHEVEICEEIKENFTSMLLLKGKKVEETEGHYFKIGVIMAN